MKAPAFDYVRASSIENAIELLEQHGPDAKLLAGGQSLLATLAFRLSEPSILIDIGRIPALKGIAHSGGVLRIGAGTTHAELGRNPLIAEHAPLLSAAAPLIAHAAIRNRGTIGGSLAYADPASELPACALALDARIVVAGKSGQRTIPADQFFTGLLSTALTEAEIITAVEVRSASAQHQAIEEIVRRSGDYAMAGAAINLRLSGATVETARVALFGVGETAVLAGNAAAALTGQPLSASTISAAVAAAKAELDPPADQHGGPETKRHLAGVALERALKRLMTSERERAA